MFLKIDYQKSLMREMERYLNRYVEIIFENYINELPTKLDKNYFNQIQYLKYLFKMIVTLNIFNDFKAIFENKKHYSNDLLEFLTELEMFFKLLTIY